MKKFLVIGGSSGIGAALTKKLRQQGHEVIATFNTGKPDNTTGAHFHKLDVLDQSVDLAVVGHGLDGLVFCPGNIRLAPFHRINTEEFLGDFNLQVLGAIKVLQAARPLFNEGGSVVLFSTVAVQTGFSFHSQVATSKGAIEGLTRALAAEWAPKVRVNAIAPSITETPLSEKLLNSEEKKATNAARHPLRSIGRPEDIAGMASFLLSDDARWISGQIMTVDGGISSLRH